jgi:transcriptional regulator with XRE-family HTH domain
LAETLGVTDQAVYYWERDMHRPNRGAMIALRDLYGIDIEEWFRHVA